MDEVFALLPASFTAVRGLTNAVEAPTRSGGSVRAVLDDGTVYVVGFDAHRAIEHEARFSGLYTPAVLAYLTTLAA